MNLKKYLSVGHVVEDMNHLHGRYHHSRPGMIRFEARAMGSVRSTGGARGPDTSFSVPRQVGL